MEFAIRWTVMVVEGSRQVLLSTRRKKSRKISRKLGFSAGHVASVAIWLRIAAKASQTCRLISWMRITCSLHGLIECVSNNCRVLETKECVGSSYLQ